MNDETKNLIAVMALSTMFLAISTLLTIRVNQLQRQADHTTAVLRGMIIEQQHRRDEQKCFGRSCDMKGNVDDPSDIMFN